MNSYRKGVLSMGATAEKALLHISTSSVWGNPSPATSETEQFKLEQTSLECPPFSYCISILDRVVKGPHPRGWS